MVYLLRYLRETLGVFSSSEKAVTQAKRYWDQLPDYMKPDVYGKPNQWYYEFNIIPLPLDESVKPSVLDEEGL